MKAHVALIDAHVDLQEQVMLEVARAVHSAGTELCQRDGQVKAGEARWAFTEGVIESLFASLYRAGGVREKYGPEGMQTLAILLVRKAIEHVESTAPTLVQEPASKEG